MKTIIIHAIAYGLAYLLLAVLFVGCMGVVNKLMHKPFLNRWKNYLLWFTFSLASGWLLDLVPRKLLMIVGVPAGMVLLAVVLWVFVKYPSYKQKRVQRDVLTKPPVL
ncbi:MAG: hypothetical protein M3Y13_04795 [Armatimonadota bacterium]|nr:hypothetical protein [Armatimonadota bacterium]